MYASQPLSKKGKRTIFSKKVMETTRTSKLIKVFNPSYRVLELIQTAQEKIH